MPEYPSTCLQCGRPSRSIDKDLVCDGCLAETEAVAHLHAAFDEARRASQAATPTIPLSPVERRERLRELLDSW